MGDGKSQYSWFNSFLRVSLKELMLLQRTNPQSVETFPIMPRNAFKAPKTKRSPAKQETELYASSSKKRRTKDDFYTFCTIVLSYTQYDSLKREEMRQQNNISPVGSGGSAADSYSSDSTASLSSGSLQECLQDSLQDGLPVDRVQQPTQDTTPTAISSSNNNNNSGSNNSNQLNERVTTPQQVTKQQHQTPKQHQQTIKPLQQSPQQSKQPNLKQSSPTKNQLSVYDVKHKQPKQQQQQQQPPQPQQQEENRRQTSPKHQQPQIKQEPSVSAQTTPPSVTPTPSPVTPSHHQNNTNRMESQISPKAIKLEPSTYSPPEQNSHQEQLPEDKIPNRFELLQRPKQEENNLITGGKQKIHIKKEVVDEEIMKDKENEISKVSSQERRVNAVRKANLRYSKLEVNTSHENAESNTDSCADSIHSNCSSSPDVNETDEESWDLITCHCLKPYAGRPMIECSECSTWIHLSCAKIRKSNIPETFVCQQCREAKFTTRKSNRIRTESKRISI